MIGLSGRPVGKAYRPRKHVCFLGWWIYPPHLDVVLVTFFFFLLSSFLSYHQHISVSVSWLCDTQNLTPNTIFCRHTTHFLKHLLSLQLFLTCKVLPVKPVALFHSFLPQYHNSSLCFEMLFRRCVNPAFLQGSLRASLTLLTCCKSYNHLVRLRNSSCLLAKFVPHIEIRKSGFSVCFAFY